MFIDVVRPITSIQHHITEHTCHTHLSHAPSSILNDASASLNALVYMCSVVSSHHILSMLYELNITCFNNDMVVI